MKRALFVTVGTIAGLTATLRYTPENPLLNLDTDLALGGSQALGDSQSQTATPESSPKVPEVNASKSAVAIPVKSATPQTVVPSKTTGPTPVQSSVAKPKSTPTPKKTVKATPTKTVKPTPTPKKTVKPTPTSPPTTPPTTAPTPTPTIISATGNGALAGPYGTVQVSIQVTNGHMTSITKLLAPSGGRSGDITNYAIPRLIQAALNSHSSNVATISGASFTSQAFRTSLASAMAKAGL